MAKKKEAPASPFVPEEEQPYPIPENWCWVYWGNIGEFTAGSGFKNEYQGFVEYQIPFYKVGSLKYSDENGVLHDNSNTISEEIRVKLKAALIPSQSIIFAKIGEAIRLNRRSINAVPCCIDNNLMAFQAKGCFWRYAFYWTLGLDLYTYTNATTVPAIRKSDLEAIPFPLPPLPEQHRIVTRIESLFAKLDEAKEKAQAVVDGYELRKSAILHKAFTGELTERWRKEHGVGMDSWTKRKLKDCGDWCGGGTPSMAHPEYWDGGDLLWITSKDMKSDIIEDTLLHTNMAGVNNSSANYIERPSVLFVMRSGILRRTLPIAMVKVPFTVNQDLKAVSPVNDLDLEYFFWVCKNAEKRMLGTCMKNGTTVESINTKTLMEFEIPVASQSEQREIVNCIIGLLDKEQQAKEAAEAVLGQINTMKKAILARAFRGELGTNDPAEEWAGELVREILKTEVPPQPRAVFIPEESEKLPV